LAEGLMQELRNTITQRNPVAGRFTRVAGANPAFEQRLVRYLGSHTDGEFISFSRDATNLLCSEMRRESLATGGYMVFAEHTHADEAFLLVVMLSTRAQPSFDEELNLISSITLDFDHLRHAGRIKLSAVPVNEDGVVHFVSRRAEGMSDYFRVFLGCEAVTDSTAQGNLLFSALRRLAAAGRMAPSDADSMMQRTYSYWQDCRRSGESMTLTALANCLRNAPSKWTWSRPSSSNARSCARSTD